MEVVEHFTNVHDLKLCVKLINTKVEFFIQMEIQPVRLGILVRCRFASLQEI